MQSTQVVYIPTKTDQNSVKYKQRDIQKYYKLNLFDQCSIDNYTVHRYIST